MFQPTVSVRFPPVFLPYERRGRFVSSLFLRRFLPLQFVSCFLPIYGQRETKPKPNERTEMNKKTQNKPTVDRESVRLLAIELGVREAARQCGLSEDRVRKWSSRYKWLEQKAPKQQEAAVTVVTTPGDVLIATHRELEGRTKTGLAQAIVRAAEEAATAANPLPVSNTAHLRDLAASAVRIFGWDNNDKPGVQLNQQFVITPEQLERIRQLRGTED
jgi:hypothetical protein